MVRNPKHTKRLTKLVIEAFTCPPGRTMARLFDSELTGFGVMATPRGVKSFFYIYGPAARRRQLTIGRFGPLTVTQAREMARVAAGRVAMGLDPQDEKIGARKAQAQTFKAWVAEYLALIEKRKAHVRSDKHFLSWAAHRIGTLPLVAVTTTDVERLVGLVKAEGLGPTARWKGKSPSRTTTANRFLASIRACLAHAWRRGLIPENPALRIRPFPENPPRQRVLSDEELSRVLSAVSELGLYEKAALTIIIETGCRTSEALRARWEDIDLDGKLWRIPRPKSGRRGEVIPLPDSTVEMLRTLPRMEDCPFIIPGLKPGHPRASLKRAWQAVRNAAGVPDVTLHDLRRTYGLAIARTAGIHVASRLLRHSNVAITSRVYAPLGVDELSKATNEAAEKRNKLRLVKAEGA